MDKLNKAIEAEAAKLFAEGKILSVGSFTAGCNFMAEYLQKQFDEQRAKIAGDAFDAGKRWAKNEYKETFVWNKKEENPFPDKQQYLLSINSKENE